jgi:chromosome partitioning protein
MIFSNSKLLPKRIYISYLSISNYNKFKKKGVVMIIPIINQKGGVGKTTTAVNLASRFAKMEHKTLLIDLDPQANATIGVGLNSQERAFTNVDFSEYLSVMPSSKELSFKVLENDSLKNILKEEDFEFILIDCPPTLNHLSINALTAGDFAIIPLRSGDYYSLFGLKDIFSTIESSNSNLDFKILVTNIDERRSITSHFIKKLIGTVGKEKLFSTGIRIDTKLSEAPFIGKAIDLYDANSKGSIDYGDLAMEILNLN